ncbi:DMT family transporter [Pseudoalteromonas porphyrae]|uniref:EamA-like transporter family protein n=1 Tax=Pseudoalteromonas porphyrae TaxID=187330 RepID=A0A0N0LXJ7_9GAMM|nr:DMT family transporter [Pseudoalteromonas porphyrae]KPH60009.1 hypothetical protein ADS77_16645 [Pseudoalteromonas porphyrae]
MNILGVMGLSAGAAIAFQAAMNAQLGKVLQNNLLATCYAFLSSFLIIAVLTAYVWVNKEQGSGGEQAEFMPNSLGTVPWVLWLSGLFSTYGVASLYYLIPKYGVGNVMSYALTGQIVIAIIISHFGLFDSPIKEVSMVKVTGAVLLVLGVILINKD